MMMVTVMHCNDDDDGDDSGDSGDRDDSGGGC